jgi:hypothetical protein
MTRRPAQYLESDKFEFEAQDRLRAGIVERVVVRKKRETAEGVRAAGLKL